MNILLLILVSLIGCVYSRFCDTFNNKCTAELGKPLHNENNANVVKLDTNGKYYFSITLGADQTSVDIDLSIYYGSVEIYAARNREPKPSDYDYSSIITGDQDFMRLANPGGSTVYQVLIRAWSATETNIMVSTSTTTVQLSLGLAQKKRVAKNTVMKYSFTVPDAQSEFNLLCTSYSGSLPAMTLTRPGSRSTIESSYNSSAGFISFVPRQNELGQTFTLSIASTNSSIYSVVTRKAHNDASPPVLMAGNPQYDMTGSFTEQYYLLHVPAGINGPVNIFVDTIQGDADLFVNPFSRGFFHRTRSTSDNPDQPSVWSSQTLYSDSVSIPFTDSHYIKDGGLYCITVFGFVASEFNIRVSLATTVTTLVEQYPTTGSIGAGEYQYYRFYDTEPTKDVVLDLNPLSGDADLLVGCMLNPTGTDAGFPSKLIGHYNFSSQLYREDSLVISASDVHSCSHQYSSGDSATDGVAGIFYIAVVGYSTSVYTLGAIHQGDAVTLTPGNSVTGMVYRRTYLQYRLRLGFQAQDLLILLSPEYGDGDLYVKMDGSVANVNNYDYKSTTVGKGTDQILIPEEEICQNCWISIAVYGYESTKFSLVATLSDGTISLYNGIAQKGSVGSSAIQYYVYSASSDCSVNAVITVTSANEPAIYMSTSVERPTATSADTVKYDSNGAVPALVLPSVTAGATVYIGVAGAGSNVSYSIRVNEVYPESAHKAPVLLTLKDGQPQSDSILYSAPSAWLYYQLSTPIGHETIQIRSTSTIGNVELYVVRCNSVSITQCSTPAALPNTTHYSQSTVDLDQDSLTIHRNDATEGIYIIGVKSTSYNAAYQISASFENSILELQSGVTVMDHVELHGTDYFSFYFNQIETSLSFILTTISGDPDMYVSITTDHPSSVNSTWKSFRYGSDVLDIDPKTDEHACIDCVYYVAVYGNTEATYSISVALEDTMQQLVDGQPISGSVRTMNWAYYSFYLMSESARDFQVNLLSITGNADVYVTMDGSIPTKYNYAYKSISWSNSDILNILHTDSQYVMGRVIIGIYGTYASSYRLTLTTAGETIVLPLNTVQRGLVMSGGNTQYKTMLSQSGSTAPFALRFSVTPYSGHVSLYVTCVYQLLAVTYNTSLWWIKDVPNEGGTLDILSMAAADQGCLHGSEYYATVHGDTSASYSIMASVLGNDTLPLLVPGTATPGSVANHEMNYFSLRPTSNLYDDLRLSLTVLQGDVDLYVSASWQTRPQYSGGVVKSYKYSSTNFGTDEIVLTHDQVQTLCAGRAYCYLVVAAFGAYGAETPSRYSLLLSTEDSTIQLANGVPRVSSVATGRLQYFKYTMTIPNYDLVISVTPFSGDPDMYVGLAPLTHPYRLNYTWSQSMIGADSLTVQYAELSKKCVPDAYHNCEIYIGVYGWQNSTFSILANLDEGFLSPSILLDQTPQNGYVAYGGYAYYKYFVNIAPPSASSQIPVSLKFTVTPTDGGDPDLYAIFSNHSEPGQNNYHYKSTSYSSVTDSIEVTYDMPHYCFNCIVYLSVYGFSKGAFTIQATSTGLTQLQADTAMGGAVRQDKMNYYTFYNALQFAEMRLALTTISGDADIYVNTRSASDTTVKLPTKTSYKWRSLSTGADSISITYEDSKFCFNCEYIIGIYGFRNSTYTLLVSNSAASVIKLTQNRPQTMSIDVTGRVQYFSATFLSSVSDITISLTSLNTGYADMYAAVYNASTYYSGSGSDLGYPIPGDPSTYQYTTAGTEDNLLRMPPRSEEGLIVIAVVALSPVQFSIVASSSNSQNAVLLQSGVPQNHFVELHENELFKFYPSADEDLRITVTARSGDPDLFVSSEFHNPHCTSGTQAWETVCSNYTWSSRMYSTDQILLSRDMPCNALVTSTFVDPSCNADTAFVPSNGQPIYIGVYGYAAAKFSILVAPVGSTIQLLAGQPQLSTTTSGYVCDKRSATSGACLTSSTISKAVQVGYFAFHVALPSEYLSKTRRLGRGVEDYGRLLADMMTVSDVMLTVAPSCNASKIIRDHNDTITSCPLGCDCNPLVMYVNSCPVSKCTPLDQRPSELSGQHKASLVISASTGGTLFLTSEPGGGSSSAYCSPSEAGEDCAYYIAVAVTPTPRDHWSSAPEETASFSITARTPGDIILVPCDSKEFPDGIKSINTDILTDTAHHYELCGSNVGGVAESLIVDLEQCYGSTTLYACADDNKCDTVLPTEDSWAYKSDPTQNCVHTFDARGKTTCTKTNAVDSSRVTLTLPPRSGNYYVAATGDMSKYVLTIQNTIHNGARASPKLVTSGMQDDYAKSISADQVSGNSMTLRWHTAQVVIPGVATPIFAVNMRYRAYIIDLTNLLSERSLNYLFSTVKLNSFCGLEYAADLLDDRKYLQVVPITPQQGELDQGFQTRHFHKLLTPGHDYKIIITASCDGNCLRLVTKSLSSKDYSSSYSSCGSSTDDCKSQTMVYATLALSSGATADADDDTSSDNDKHHTTSAEVTVTVITVVLIVAILLALLGAGYYYYRKNYMDQEYEVAMSESTHSNSFDITKGPSGMSFSDYLDRTKDATNAGRSFFSGAVSSVSNFVGSLSGGGGGGARGSDTDEHGVRRSYGEIQLNRHPSSSSSSGEAGTSKGVWGSMLNAATGKKYAKVEEDDDAVTEITL